jgi:hypothetical protein
MPWRHMGEWMYRFTFSWPWLVRWGWLSYKKSSLYRLCKDHTEIIWFLPSEFIGAYYCLATSCNIRPIVAGFYRRVFIEQLPSNVLSNIKKRNNVSKSNLRLTVLQLLQASSLCQRWEKIRSSGRKEQSIAGTVVTTWSQNCLEKLLINYH